MHEDGSTCVTLVKLQGTLIPAKDDSGPADAPTQSRVQRFFARQDRGADIQGGLRLRKLSVQLLLLDQVLDEVYSEVHVTPELREVRNATFAADANKYKGGLTATAYFLKADASAETNPQAARQHTAVKRCLELEPSFLDETPPPETETAALSLWRDRVACDDEDIQPADRSDHGWAAACKLGWQQRVHGGTGRFPCKTGPIALCHADGRPRCTNTSEARRPASLLVVVHAHAMAFDVIGGGVVQRQRRRSQDVGLAQDRAVSVYQC